MKIKIKIPRSYFLFILLILYRLILDFSFLVFVHPYYDYTGFSKDLTVIKGLESYAVLGLLFAIMPKDNKKVSSSVYQLLFLMAYIPIGALYFLENHFREWFYLASLFFFIVTLILKSPFKLKLPSVSNKPTSLTWLILACTTISLITVIAIVSSMETSFILSFDQKTIYGLREKYNEIDVPLIGYLRNWATKSFLPFIGLTAFIARKKIIPLASIIGIALIYLLFTHSGHKGSFFIIFMCFGLWFLMATGDFFRNLLVMLILIPSACLAIFFLTEDILIPSMFIRRLLFVPASISYEYFEFFNHNYIYLSHSIFSGFISYPYDLSPAKLIGDIYGITEGTNANNGIISDGFKNFGRPGLVLWAILFGVIAKIADAVTQDKDKYVLFPLILATFYSCINAALLTSLLTHGIIITLLICYLYPKNSTIRKFQFRIPSKQA